MATRTASVSGLWSDTATWGGEAVPVNGDAVIINSGVTVLFNVNQSGFANGLLSMQINGVLHVDADGVTCLKMNGNITGTGALYICERATVTGFTLTTGKTNTYQVSRSLDVATVEDTLGDGYLDAVEELVEVAIDTENAARVAQDLNEMMPDAVQTFIETTKASLTLSQILTYVEATQGSFYHDTVNDVLYIHTSDSTDPTGKTITVIEPINRPASGSEYRSYILFNSTGTIAMTGTPIIRMYGWYPEREWTQTAADAAAGQNQIVLVKDLDLQAGDKIAIGAGTVNGQLSEAAKGVYIVQSYDGLTKTITCTTTLQTARLEYDYVCIVNRPITMKRASGTNAYINTKTNNLVFEGVYSDTGIISGTYSDLSTFSENIVCKHCTSGNKVLMYYVINSVARNCNRVEGASSDLIYGVNNLCEQCIGISGSDLVALSKSTVNNCIQQNTDVSSTGIVKNTIFKNLLAVKPLYVPVYSNCVFDGADNQTGVAVTQSFYTTFLSCVFKDNDVGWLKYVHGILRNCIFDGENEIEAYNYDGRMPYQIIESFDHNQQPGNYKAWMKGGKIETDLDGTTPLPGRLILSCESADYPVFRDFPVLLPAYRTSTWQALTKKSFTGGSVKIELIDPANDPLIDPSAQPLASYSLPDIADTNFPLKLGYKSSVPMQAIIRISAQNSTGTVEIDTRLIENRVQHGQ